MRDMEEIELPVYNVEFWLKEIDEAERRLQRFWRDGDAIAKRYMLEEESLYSSHVAHYNIFWSNVQTLKPAYYSRVPKVEAQREFGDKDAIGGYCADIIERAAQQTITDSEFHDTMLRVVEDRLIIGRGTAWVKYEATFLDDETFTEKVIRDYVHWKDYLHSDGRINDEVWWKARRVYYDRRTITERFGAEVAAQISFNQKQPNHLINTDNKPTECAEIFEIWCKRTKRVYWIARGWDNMLDEIDDPFGLPNFYPCPEPLCSTLTNNSVIPIADYRQYETQLILLDLIQSRIAHLVGAIKVIGVYDSSQVNLANLLNADNGKMIPVDNWAAMFQKGGIARSFEMLDITPYVNAIKILYEIQNELLDEIYQVSSLSDIMRGNTDPRETATAQQIKGQFATLRLATSQQDVQRFAKDLIEMTAHIIRKFFKPESIAKYANIQELGPEVQQAFPQIMELLRNDDINFRVNIETDSTIAIDQQVEKQTRNEFMGAFGNFFSQASALAREDPTFKPMIYETMLWVLRAYKVNKSLEAMLEQNVEQSQQQVMEQMQNPQPPPPDPRVEIEGAKLQLESQKAQAEIQMGQQRLAGERQAHLEKLQLEFQKMQSDASLKLQELQATVALEGKKAESELQLAILKLKNESEKAKAAIVGKLAAENIKAEQNESDN